jgi:hypothetical protein
VWTQGQVVYSIDTKLDCVDTWAASGDTESGGKTQGQELTGHRSRLYQDTNLHR